MLSNPLITLVLNGGFMKIILSLLIILGLTACAERSLFKPENRSVMHEQDLSLESEVKLIAAVGQPIVRNADGTLCYGPQPDATIDRDLSGNRTSGSLLSATDDEKGLGGRNPNVLITRDILFQSCLAEARLKLSDAERKELFLKTLDVIQAMNSVSLDGESIESDFGTAD